MFCDDRSVVAFFEKQIFARLMGGKMQTEGR